MGIDTHMHLRRPNFIHSHLRPRAEHRHHSQRLRSSCMLDMTRLRLAEEMIRYAMPQQTREFLLRHTRFLGKLSERCSRLERNEVLDVVFENGF